jgi:hypothetical protein
MGLFESIPMVAVAVIYEVSKWCLLREVVLKRHSGTIKVIIFTLWIFTTSSSIIACAGYVLNQSNASKNVNIEASASYQNQIQSREIKKDLYSTKKKEMEDLIATKNQTIVAMEKTRDSWPKNYITMRENAQSQINKKIVDFDKEIKQKSDELSTLSTQLDVPIKVDNVLSTSGYTAIFSLMSDFMNKNDTSATKNPYKPENIELWFYLLIGIGVEALANMFAYLSQKDKFYSSELKPKVSEVCENTKLPKVSQKFKLKPAALVTNHIGFKPEPKVNTHEPEIDEKDFQKYIEYMYDKQKNGYAPGYIDIARNINIAVEKARAIKGELNRRGIIKTVGNRSIIVK